MIHNSISFANPEKARTRIKRNDISRNRVLSEMGAASWMYLLRHDLKRIVKIAKIRTVTTDACAITRREKTGEDNSIMPITKVRNGIISRDKALVFILPNRKRGEVFIKTANAINAKNFIFFI